MAFIQVCTSDTCIIWYTSRVPLSRDQFIKIIVYHIMHENSSALWRSIFASLHLQESNGIFGDIDNSDDFIIQGTYLCQRVSDKKHLLPRSPGGDFTGGHFFLSCRYLYGTPLWLSLKILSFCWECVSISLNNDKKEWSYSVLRDNRF